MSILMLFLDGVGIGSRDPSVNPVYSGVAPLLASLLDNVHPITGNDSPELLSQTIALDACFGVDGLPQSGTGQTALFTGINASGILKRHFGPYPHSEIRPIVKEYNVFKQLLHAGKSVFFANAFPQRFFDHIEKRKAHITVTTLSALSSGVAVQREGDLREGRAISADVTGIGWHALGHPDIPVIEPREAGRRLAKLTRESDFVLFEYWKTDHAGHSLDWQEATDVLAKLDGLLRGLMEELNVEETLLLMTSDHGNIEDMTTKVHTRNPVPLVLCGTGHREFSRLIENPEPDLTCITPAIVKFLTIAR